MWPFIVIFVPGILIIIKSLQDIDMGATCHRLQEANQLPHVIYVDKGLSWN